MTSRWRSSSRRRRRHRAGGSGPVGPGGGGGSRRRAVEADLRCGQWRHTGRAPLPRAPQNLDNQTRPDQTNSMKTVNIQEAKTHLSRLVEEAAAGNDVVIAKAGKPMVRLVPVTTLAGPRPLGLLADRVKESADCWDPDPEVEDLFYGSAAEPEGPSPDSDLPSSSRRGDAPT